MFLYLILFPIDVRPKKGVSCFQRSFLSFFAQIDINPQKMCDEAVDECLAAVKRFSDWLV